MPELSENVSEVSADNSLQSIPVPPSPSPSTTIKSSNEILCELFGAFNATPPPLDDIVSQSVSAEKIQKKHKKRSKKKHKKLKKKRSSSSESKTSRESKKKSKKQKKESKKSTSDSESFEIRKKKKRKLGKFSEDSDSEDEPKPKKKKKNDKEKKHKSEKVKIKQEKEEHSSSKKNVDPLITTVHGSIQEDILKYAVSKIVDKVIDSTNLASEIFCKSIANVQAAKNLDVECAKVLSKPIKQEPGLVSHVSPTVVVEKAKETPPTDLAKHSEVSHIVKSIPVADVFAEDLIDCGIKKDELKSQPDKTSGKITIPNLKFSQVYQATVQKIEEEAKLKAEKYEEGELSETSSDQERSPTPSSHGSLKEEKEEKRDRERRRHHHHRRDKHRHHERHRERRRDRSRSREKSHGSHSDSKYRRRDKHSREKERIRHRSDSDSRERERIRHRSDSGSRDRERTRYRSDSGSRERERTRHRSNSSSRERERTRHRPRSKSRDRTKRPSEDKIDKQKLLEIARRNALNMMKNPSGAADQTKVAITSGGKTVNELTDFCKLLSKKDADGHESISSNTSHSSDSESEKPFHHPFQIRDRPNSIVMNIRNSVALPVKSHQEKTAEQSRQLRLQFPVSSGQHHRKTESEWIPVSPKKAEVIPSTQVAVIKPTTKPARVFRDAPDPPNMDISSIVSQRLMAMRRLQENPTDPEALTQMYAAQQNMQSWAESKQLPPGQFTGSTGVKVLSQAELASGYQAWARRVGTHFLTFPSRFDFSF
ncbi:hypothetical protein J6590_098988 [Homalodisca vitripennis]|nr:hypothetical protein J6590_098988 [Homalodisca vitripennis]